MITRAKHFLFFLFLLAMSVAYPQNANYTRLEKVMPEIIYSDLYGNIYAIEDYQFTKIDANGKIICSYGDFKLGHITSADVSNPQKIMLFYRDAGVILFLDENLAPITANVELFEANLRTISAAAYSTSNHIWLYDESNSDLIRTDFQLNLKDKIHLPFSNVHALQLFEIAEKTLVLTTLENGIYFFDEFGTLTKHLTVESQNPIQIINNKIFYLKENKLHEYDSRLLDEKVYDIGKENLQQVLITQENIIILTEKGECFTAPLHEIQQKRQ